MHPVVLWISRALAYLGKEQHPGDTDIRGGYRVSTRRNHAGCDTRVENLDKQLLEFHQ